MIWYLILSMHVLMWAGVLVGLWRIVRAIRRGTRKFTNPVCAKCEYDLTGLPTTSDRCPECGARLAAPSAIRTGENSLAPMVRHAGLIVVVVALWCCGAMWGANRLKRWELEISYRPYRLENAISHRNNAEVGRLLALDPRLANRFSTHDTLGHVVVRDIPEVLPALLKYRKLDEKLSRTYRSGLEEVPRQRRSLLHLAAVSDSEGCINYLIDAGLPVDVRDERGRTPLHEALEANQVRAIEALMLRGASPDAADHAGRTPMLEAVEGQRLWVIHAFLKNGSKLTGVDVAGRTPLHLAMQNITDIHTKKRLIERSVEVGFDLNVQDQKGQTPLHVACQSGSVETVRALVAAGANPLVRDKDGKTPIDHAAVERKDAVSAALSQR